MQIKNRVEASRTIQAAWRIKAARLRLDLLKQKAAVTIQCGWRRKNAVKELLLRKLAAAEVISSLEVIFLVTSCVRRVETATIPLNLTARAFRSCQMPEG